MASRRRGGPGCAAGAARPSAPRANHPDRPSLPMTRRQAALATMGLRVCHGRSQQRHALRRCAGRRVAPRAPRSRPPHSHRDRRRDADKSAREQPRHAATSPAARSISAHFHWRKSVPHPVTEYPPALPGFLGTYGPLRHPDRPDLTLAGCPLARATPPAGLPVLRPLPPSTRAAATTPAEPVGARVARFPTAGSLPRIPGGSASASLVSRPAQRSVVAARVVAEPPWAALCRRSASADVVASIVRPDCYRLERQLPGGVRTR